MGTLRVRPFREAILIPPNHLRRIAQGGGQDRVTAIERVGGVQLTNLLEEFAFIGHLLMSYLSYLRHPPVLARFWIRAVL